MDISTHELERLRRTVAWRAGSVAMRFRGGPFDGIISHTTSGSWRWANFIGWCERDEREHVVQVLYSPGRSHNCPWLTEPAVEVAMAPAPVVLEALSGQNR